MNDPHLLGSHIRSDFYLRERLLPEFGDSTYLHLSDLRLSLEAVKNDSSICLLDYGSGGSPYKSLFPKADYRRADYLTKEGDRLDYTLDENSCVPEKNESFDFILSTQVIEHVNDPNIYIRECFRLLKPGGLMYITTHGSYPDHGCPYDFYRWTADGLAKSLKSVGFEVNRIEKHTTGARAFFFQCDCQFQSLTAPRNTVFGAGLYLFRRSYSALRPWIHKMCDQYYPNNRVVKDNLEEHSTYIVAACLVSKK